MRIESELQIVRPVLLTMLISSIAMLGFFEYLYFLESEKATLNTTPVMSGFGKINLHNPEVVSLFSTNIYQDVKLGFQVSKPNNDWIIHSILDDLDSDKLESLKTKGFLDGIYIEKNHDKRFILTVFDIQKENFSLSEYFDKQISLIQQQATITVPIKQISSSNDWAIFAVESLDDNKYNEQILFLKDNQLYMVQYYGDSPRTLNPDQKNDFHLIMDSFEII